MITVIFDLSPEDFGYDDFYSDIPSDYTFKMIRTFPTVVKLLDTLLLDVLPENTEGRRSKFHDFESGYEFYLHGSANNTDLLYTKRIQSVLYDHSHIVDMNKDSIVYELKTRIIRRFDNQRAEYMEFIEERTKEKARLKEANKLAKTEVEKEKRRLQYLNLKEEFEND